VLALATGADEDVIDAQCFAQLVRLGGFVAAPNFLQGDDIGPVVRVRSGGAEADRDTDLHRSLP
jgi:hypothetical protein